MVKAKNRIELAKAIAIDKQDVVVVEDPELIEYLVKKGAIKVPPPDLQTGLYSADQRMELDPEIIRMIIEALLALALIVFGYFLVKKGLEKDCDVTIELIDPKTGKIKRIVFTKRKKEKTGNG